MWQIEQNVKMLDLNMLPLLTCLTFEELRYKAAIYQTHRIIVDLSFYPFYFATAIAMWLSVLAIILWFIQSLAERNSK